MYKITYNDEGKISSIIIDIKDLEIMEYVKEKNDSEFDMITYYYYILRAANHKNISDNRFTIYNDNPAKTRMINKIISSEWLINEDDIKVIPELLESAAEYLKGTFEENKKINVNCKQDMTTEYFINTVSDYILKKEEKNKVKMLK